MLNTKWEQGGMKLLQWAQELQTIAQTGLTYADDSYDIARYNRLRELAAQMLSQVFDASVEDVHRLLLHDAGHPTPKIDVRAVILYEKQILLVQEAADQAWSLPGGWADPGESARTAIEREVWEETGYEVQATRLLAVYDRAKHGHPPYPFAVYKLFFACSLADGVARTSNETTAVQFFSLHELPPISLERVTPAQILHLAEVYTYPNRATEFD
jgi:ADP-ribose pyrophosphatase YjhB (NUDIX family)